MNFLKSKKNLIGIILFIITIIAIAFLDMVLAVGIILIAFLTLITFLALYKTGMKSKTLYLFFIIALLIHLGAVLFIYYANFQPFSGGGGDYINYNRQAQEIASRIHQGSFSLEGLSIGHYFPVIIGYVYALTLPEILIGQLFCVWLAALSALFVYLIILEIGGTKKWAFLIGLVASIYPSYLFFGSLLLKDTLVVPLILAGLLLTLKLIKNFSWMNFLFFYIILGAAIHFRFYVGYALLFTFIPCWLLLSRLNLKKKFINGIIIIILLGFLPQFSGFGYYGFRTIKIFLNPKTIVFYRETAYGFSSSSKVKVAKVQAQGVEVSEPEIIEVEDSKTTVIKVYMNRILLKIFPNIEDTSKKASSELSSSRASSIKVKTEIGSPPNFLVNLLASFSHVLLGPFPWQMRYYRHLFALVETIPWYFLLFFVIKGSIVAIRRKRIALPLLVFSIMSLVVLALFITNFGIITRIRMPSFIALLCLIPLGFQKSSLAIEDRDKEKIE